MSSENWEGSFSKESNPLSYTLQALDLLPTISQEMPAGIAKLATRSQQWLWETAASKASFQVSTGHSDDEDGDGDHHLPP